MFSHFVQIREGGTKGSNITAERKHDHRETSGFASAAFINAATTVFGGCCLFCFFCSWVFFFVTADCFLFFVWMTGGAESAGPFHTQRRSAPAVLRVLQ